ncbi:MAG: hypothetical protein M5R36_04710 [Deltaproteobacteria bacterium]|nr:hypothetical protein [Deltaproteobacteria bacterium]
MAPILIATTHATDDPTKASLAFVTAAGCIGTDRACRVVLIGEGASLARKETAAAVHGVGFPPLSELIEKVVTAKVPVFV